MLKLNNHEKNYLNFNDPFSNVPCSNGTGRFEGRINCSLSI